MAQVTPRDAKKLRCKGCDSLVEPTEAKVYATVFCCPACYEIAARHEERLNADMRRLQILVRDLIRVRLLEGRLQFSTRPDEEVSKSDLLRACVELVEMKNGTRIGPSSRDSRDQPEGGPDQG